MFQHYRSEMPYSCSVCGFRSSFHKDAVDHFQEAHDRTDKLQCPRCLKTFSLFSNNQYNANVASSYVMHLQVSCSIQSSIVKYKTSTSFSLRRCTSPRSLAAKSAASPSTPTRRPGLTSKRTTSRSAMSQVRTNVFNLFIHVQGLICVASRRLRVRVPARRGAHPDAQAGREGMEAGGAKTRRIFLKQKRKIRDRFFFRLT